MPLQIKRGTVNSAKAQSSQATYQKKKTKRKDRLGLGVLLEIIGILGAIATLPTIIGPFIGLLIFAAGFGISRQRRYFCRDCGNEMNKEAITCAACGTKYLK